MAHMIRRGLRGLAAAFIALAACLAIAPTAAFADTLTSTDTGSINIVQLDEGDEVYIYRVVDADYISSSNTFKYGWNELVSGAMSGYDIDGYIAGRYDTDTVNAALRAAVNAAEEAAGEGNAVATRSATVGADASSVEFENLEMGQYLVIIKPANEARTYQTMVINVLPGLTDGSWDKSELAVSGVVAKFAEGAVIEKKVVDAEDEDVTETIYAPGDTVRFQLEVQVPDYPTTTTTASFTITDTLTNLVDAKSDSVLIGTETVDADKYDFDYDEEKGVITITFDSDFILSSQGQTITITYTAEVASDAKHTTEVKNSVTVETNGQESSDSVEIDVFAIKVLKTDESGDPLDGASFDLYKDVNGGYNESSYVGTFTAGDNGTLTFDGVAAGTYWVVETVAPDGYKLADAQQVTVSYAEDSSGDNVVEITVMDELDSGLSLPTTGGTGTVLMTAAGVVLIAGAAAMIARSRKRD